MRKGSLAAAILIFALIPVSGHAAIDTRIESAWGQATSIYSQSAHGGGFGTSYDLHGTFKTNGVTYVGEVTGYWYYDGQGGASSIFSGSHDGVISGACYPDPGVENIVDPNILICHFSINYMRTAEFILQFAWATTRPDPNSYYSTDYAGGFVGGF